MEEALIVSMLVRWAKWKLGSGRHLGFKKQVSFVRLAGEEARCQDLGVDRECIEINDAVEQLPELYKIVIRIEYLSECRNDAERAIMLGVCKRSFISYRSNAYRYIGEYLDASKKNCLHMVHNFGMI